MPETITTKMRAVLARLGSAVARVWCFAAFCARRFLDEGRHPVLGPGAGERPVYIFMHHPPFDIGIPSLDLIRLAEPAGFARVVAEAGSVKHIFFGHVHRPVSGSWRGISFSALRSTVHQVALDWETEYPVPYTLETPAYNVIFLEPDKTVVHHHDFLDDSRLPAGQARYTKVE